MICFISNSQCVGGPQLCCGRCEKHCQCRHFMPHQRRAAEEIMRREHTALLPDLDFASLERSIMARVRMTRPTSDGRPREDERRG